MEKATLDREKEVGLFTLYKLSKSLAVHNTAPFKGTCTCTEVEIRIEECPDIWQYIHNFARTSLNFILPLYVRSINLECT